MIRSPNVQVSEMAQMDQCLHEVFRRPTYGAVAVVDGFGVRMYVERGHLVLADGIGEYRRERSFPRAGHGLKRVVLANPEGTITLAALRWCDAVKVQVVILDADGPLLTSVPQLNDARMRRQQALAPSQPVGLGIARLLIGETLRRRNSPFRAEAEAAPDLEALWAVERVAADDYWATWDPKVRFRGGPRHWSRFNGRTSMVSRANRRADRPVNAVLNYLYTLAEVECVLACYAVGLDPGLGILHLDLKRRQSMALDLLEPVRPAVEKYVAEMANWRARDFHELGDGTVRVRAPLTHELAETMPMWAAEVAPYAERVAHMLGQAMARKYTPTTPLTLTFNRRAVKRRSRPVEGADVYKQEIWPGLVDLPLKVIMEAAGVSASQASRIRRGWNVPKPSAWTALRSLSQKT